MDSRYEKYIAKWNSIFSKEIPENSIKQSSGNKIIDKGIEWICNNTEKILDFGCGNGNMLFLCAINGTKYNIGIDLSENAIKNAKQKSEQMIKGEFNFIQGGLDYLQTIDSSSFDAVILSNILDNLYPDDVEILIKEVVRVLKDNGKVLIKLNQYLTSKQITELNIKVIENDLLDDGLILLNKTTEEWKRLFSRKFNVERYEKVFYPEYEQYNRMFFLSKKV